MGKMTAGWRRWSQIIFLAMITLAAAMLGLELLLRLTGLQPPFLFQLDRNTCATHVPGLVATIPGPDGPVVVRFNSAGDRDVERSIFKPSGVIRVALLGDSLIEALQVGFPQTAAQVLENELRSALDGQAVEVLNFASSGFGTTCSYLTFHHRGAAYGPDIVVLAVYLGNDIYDNHPALAVSPTTPFFEIGASGSLALRPATFSDDPIKRWLRSHSRAYLFIRDRIKTLLALRRLRIQSLLTPVAMQAENVREPTADRRLHDIYSKNPSPLIKEAWKITDRVLGLLLDEARSRSAILMVLIIPTDEQFDPSAAQRHTKAAGFSVSKMDFDQPASRLLAILNRRGIPFVNLTPVFRASGLKADELYYPEDGHWTPTGNRVAGEALAEAILGLIRKKSGGGVTGG